MSNWYFLIHYGVFFAPAFALAIFYTVKVQPSIRSIAMALCLLIMIPVLAGILFNQHEQLAVGCGLLVGYVVALVGRYIVRQIGPQAPVVPEQEGFRWTTDQHMRWATQRDRRH